MKPSERVFTQSVVFNCSRQLTFFRLFSNLAALVVLFFCVATNSASACMPTIKHVADTMSPPNPAAGTSATVTYTVYNESQCDANGYRLAFHSVLPATPECLSGSYSGSNPTFSLAAGATGQVTATIPAAPPETAGCLVFFDILNDSDSPLPVLPGGRMWMGFGGAVGPGMCVAPMPAINSVDHVDFGNGAAAANAEVENTTGNPILEINTGSKDMESGSGGQYNGADKTGQAENSCTITAFGLCNQLATFGYNPFSNYSSLFGASSFLSNCGGTCGKNADPVNTAIGNFVYEESDAAVAGPGNSTIKLNRTYNSQAVLWTPASKVRFYPDGSSEVMAEPPQYFGKGWTSELGQYLLEIDMAPTFEGMQILYPDGHTANFKKSDSQYVSVSPGTHDVISKEGDEYVMRDADCGCASEEKRFDKDGRLTALVDRNGNAVRLFYDGDKLTALENAAGRRVEFTLNKDGQITEARLPENITLRYEYEDDLLTAFIDGRGNRTAYQYDELGQMTGIISAKGHPLVRNSYDDEYRVSEQIVGESESYGFHYEDGQTTVMDAYGNAHVHHYDGDLRLIRLKYPDGNSEYFEYDEDQNRTGYTDQAGAAWQWTYDEQGNRLTADGPLGWHRNWAYNERHQVTRMTEKVDADKERTSTFTYDDKGNLIEFCNARFIAMYG